jgi:hypothetical protein
MDRRDCSRLGGVVHHVALSIGDGQRLLEVFRLTVALRGERLDFGVGLGGFFPRESALAFARVHAICPSVQPEPP